MHQGEVERRTGKKLKTIRSDNGAEYTNNELQIILQLKEESTSVP